MVLKICFVCIGNPDKTRHLGIHQVEKETMRSEYAYLEAFAEMAMKRPTGLKQILYQAAMSST